MKTPMPRKGLWAVALVVLLPGAWFGLKPGQAAPLFETALVTRGDLAQVVTAAGQLNAVVKIQVGSQSSGIIRQLYADYNDTVVKGQVIAQLDPATYAAVVRENEALLASARDSLNLAQTQARRSRELRAGGLVAQAELDTVLSALHQAEAAVKVKEAVLERCRADLARCTIYAPVDGMVISRSVEVGQTVAASLSAPTLFQIANDLTRMQVDAKVSEADIGGIRPGQPVRFTVDAFPGRTFQGTVMQVRNEATTVSNVVTYDTVIRVSNPDLALKPGMTAVVAIVLAERAGALKIPNAALAFHPASSPASSAPTVYVLRGGTPVPVRIATGLTDGTRTEATSGLNEGDRVITGLKVQGLAPSTTKETASPLEDKRSQGPPGPPPAGR